MKASFVNKEYESRKETGKKLIAAGGCAAIKFWSNTDAIRLCPEEHKNELDFRPLEAPIYADEWIEEARKAIKLINQGIALITRDWKSTVTESPSSIEGEEKRPHWVKCMDRMPKVPNPVPPDTPDERLVIFWNERHSSLNYWFPSWGWPAENIFPLEKDVNRNLYDEGFGREYWEWLDESPSPILPVKEEEKEEELKRFTAFVNWMYDAGWRPDDGVDYNPHKFLMWYQKGSRDESEHLWKLYDDWIWSQRKLPSPAPIEQEKKEDVDPRMPLVDNARAIHSNIPVPTGPNIKPTPGEPAKDQGGELDKRIEALENDVRHVVFGPPPPDPEQDEKELKNFIESAKKMPTADFKPNKSPFAALREELEKMKEDKKAGVREAINAAGDFAGAIHDRQKENTAALRSKVEALERERDSYRHDLNMIIYSEMNTELGKQGKGSNSYLIAKSGLAKYHTQP
jgi:hypothetical protein